MKQVLDQDEAKRDWLLVALVSQHPNLVDNMTTKDNLTYSQLKVRLHSLPSNANAVPRTQDSALISTHIRRKLKGRGSRSKSPTPASSTSCTWCKARKFRHEGHVWQDCRKLKAIPPTLLKTLPHAALPTNITPYDALFKHKPSISHLQPFIFLRNVNHASYLHGLKGLSVLVTMILQPQFSRFCASIHCRSGK